MKPLHITAKAAQEEFSDFLSDKGFVGDKLADTGIHTFTNGIRAYQLINKNLSEKQFKNVLQHTQNMPFQNTAVFLKDHNNYFRNPVNHPDLTNTLSQASLKNENPLSLLYAVFLSKAEIFERNNPENNHSIVYFQPEEHPGGQGMLVYEFTRGFMRVREKTAFYPAQEPAARLYYPTLVKRLEP